MEILKHGRKTDVFVCQKCGCEFIPSAGEKWSNGTTSICPDFGETVYLINDAFDSRWADFEKIKDEILEMIDFDKIHETMTFLNWKWFDVGIPTIEQLKKRLIELMSEAWESQKSIATGGFNVKYWPKDEEGVEGLDVFFELTNANCYINENHEIEIY